MIAITQSIELLFCDESDVVIHCSGEHRTIVRVSPSRAVQTVAKDPVSELAGEDPLTQNEVTELPY